MTAMMLEAMSPRPSIRPSFRPLDQRCLAIIVSLTDAPPSLSLSRRYGCMNQKGSISIMCAAETKVP